MNANEIKCTDAISSERTSCHHKRSDVAGQIWPWLPAGDINNSSNYNFSFFFPESSRKWIASWSIRCPRDCTNIQSGQLHPDHHHSSDCVGVIEPLCIIPSLLKNRISIVLIFDFWKRSSFAFWTNSSRILPLC